MVIRLTNTAPGGCGNDLALDDITFRPCGPTITAATANNNQTMVDLCAQSVSTVLLKANIGNGYIAPAAQWQESLDSGLSWKDISGATALIYLFNKTIIGNYKYRLSIAEGTNINISSCRVASNPVSITIHGNPVVTAASNSPVCEKKLINLTAGGGTSYAWSGPASFSATIANPSFIAQSNSGGQYLVMVTDLYGCKNSAFVTVTTNAKPVAVISNTQQFCEGNSVTLQAGGGIKYLWSPSIGLSDVNIPNPVANPVDTTLYTVVITSTNNCTDTAVVSLNVLKKPTANAGNDKIILKGQPVILDGIITGSAVNFNWTPAIYLSNPSLVRPLSSPLNDIKYTLEVVSTVGCGKASDEVFIKVYNDIYVPTAFSPNNDRLNDSWHIEALVAVPEARVWVFNRYGKIIFETTGNNAQWDGTYKGKALPAGAYAYMIDLKNGRPLIKGMVMLVR